MRIMNKTSRPSQEFLSSKDAGAILGYTHDYISRLCRQNKMSGIQKGREWYVTQEELDAFKGRHEIELEEKKKELSKKFSKIRLEHEAKKREIRSKESFLQSDSKKKNNTVQPASLSIEKSIKFKIPSQFAALAVLMVFIFGSSFFDLIPKNIEVTANIQAIKELNASIDQGIQDTIYAQATAVEPVTIAVMSLSHLTKGFTYFFNSIMELPQATYVVLLKTGNTYLAFYVLQGEILYKTVLNMNTIGVNVLKGYELIGQSFYVGSRDMLNLYSNLFHLNTSIKTSQNVSKNFVANVSGGFGYAKETIEDTFFKKTTLQIKETFNTWILNIDSNVSTIQSNITNISHDMGAYIGSTFNLNFIKKDSEIRSIQIKQ